MLESEDEIRELQALIDRTFAQANPHLAGIVKPERRLTARQATAHLQGINHVAFATVTAGGAPRVSPLDTLFVHGRFTLSTGSGSTRARHLRQNPACSAVHLQGDRIAIVANGTVEWITREHPEHDEIHRVWSEAYESDPYTWGDGVVLFRLRPTSMWAYAFHPEEFPE